MPGVVKPYFNLLSNSLAPVGSTRSARLCPKPTLKTTVIKIGFRRCAFAHYT